MADFWIRLDDLLHTSSLVIDRPKDSKHPRYPSIIYPLDYGYLDGTSAGDGDGIDVWRGSLDYDTLRLQGVLLTADSVKRDAEIKIVVNCTSAEIETIVDFYHDNKMGIHWLPRPESHIDAQE